MIACPELPDPAVPMQQIADAALHRLLTGNVATAPTVPLAEVRTFGPVGIPGAVQNNVVASMAPGDEALPLAELAQRYIDPMIANLAICLRPGIAFVELEVPAAVPAARSSNRYGSLRACFQWVSSPDELDEEGEPLSYGPPRPTLRFDILTVPA